MIIAARRKLAGIPASFPSILLASFGLTPTTMRSIRVMHVSSIVSRRLRGRRRVSLD
jgi:hypothetical protein